MLASMVSLTLMVLLSPRCTLAHSHAGLAGYLSDESSGGISSESLEVAVAITHFLITPSSSGRRSLVRPVAVSFALDSLVMFVLTC